jgi:hypothetical protein
MSSVDVVVDDVTIVVSVDNPVIQVTIGGPSDGGGGGGGLDQATADALYVNKTGSDDQTIESNLDIWGTLSSGGYYAGGDIENEGKVSTHGLVVFNGDRTQYGVQIRRTQPAVDTNDPEIFAIYNGTGISDNERGSWANERGQWRTSNIPAPGEDALKIIGATAATGNMIVATKQDGTIVFRVGPNGTTIAELGLRLVAGAALGRVLVGDGSGNATWQPVPCATGVAAPASPYVGQLWADPN